MASPAAYYAHLLAALATGSNRAAAFTDDVYRSVDLNLDIASKDFKLVLRGARVGDNTGYFIMCGSASYGLDTFGFYQQGGTWLVYVQEPNAQPFFRAITDAQKIRPGTFVEISFERLGNTFIARQNGVEQWRDTRSSFVLPALNSFNINIRGGSGGGGQAQFVADYLYLEVTEASGVVRYLDYAFNERDGDRAESSGTLTGRAYSLAPLTYQDL